MPTRKLQPGKGAKASVLTRMIRPKQHLPNHDKEHRSDVILEDQIEDEKGKEVYSFRYAEDGTADGMLLHASVRYVKVVEEGDKERFFNDIGEGEEALILWKDSEARRLLYEDVRKGDIPLEARERDADGNLMMTLQDIYTLRPEFAAYDYNKFSGRLSTIRDIVKKLNIRAEEDEEAFDTFVENHPVSLYDRKGYTHWQGSKSQELAKQDIESGLLQQGYRALFQSRPEYFMEYSFKEWSDKIRQEIKTKKYLHTLKVKGKQHKSS